MISILKILLKLILMGLVIVPGTILGQESYYVSSEGNDFAEGTKNAPWRTIQHGISQVKAGQTLFLRQGIYRENVDFIHSGVKLAPIVLAAFPGEKVILDGSDNVTEDGMINIMGHDYIVIRGLEIRNNDRSEFAAGIRVRNSQSIILENNRIHGNGTGIHIENPNIQYFFTSHTIRNNEIYHNGNAGLIIGPLDPNADSGTTEGVTISNNTFFENDSWLLGHGEIILSYCHHAKIVNNIFNTNEQSKVGEVRQYYYFLEFENNAYFTQNGAEVLAVEWNDQVIAGFGEFAREYAFDTLGIFVNPLFINPEGGLPDLHLSPNSPLIDTGSPYFIPGTEEFDIDGQARLNGNQVDIGSDEFHINLIICSLGFLTAELSGQNVLINWTGTCYAENGGSYQVQRSRDTFSWDSIGQVESDQDQLSKVVNYQFTDTNPTEGISYYRVRFTDENGSFLDTNWDSVVYAEGGILVYPNPVSEDLKIITSPHISIGHSVQLIAPDGRSSRQLAINQDGMVSLTGVQKGFYMIVLMDESGNRQFLLPIIKN